MDLKTARREVMELLSITDSMKKGMGGQSIDQWLESDPSSAAQWWANTQDALDMVREEYRKGAMSREDMLEQARSIAERQPPRQQNKRGRLMKMVLGETADASQPMGATPLIHKGPAAMEPGTVEAQKEAARFGVPASVYEEAFQRQQLRTGETSLIDELNAKYDGYDHTGWYADYLGVPFKLPWSKEIPAIRGVYSGTVQRYLDKLGKRPRLYEGIRDIAVREGAVSADADPRSKETAIAIITHYLRGVGAGQRAF
jgi:hypothetical protein